MKNHKKNDKLFVNKISDTDGVKSISGKSAGDAAEEPFCVYAHERHAVGSKIINEDGSESVCQDDSTWQNTH
jgi:hypothetical protein